MDPTYLKGKNTLTGFPRYPQNTPVYWGPLPDTIQSKDAAIAYVQGNASILNTPLLAAELGSGTIIDLVDLTVGTPVTMTVINDDNVKTYIVPRSAFSGTQSLTYSAGLLPTGITFNPTTQTLTYGTSLTSGTFSVDITGTDGYSSATITITQKIVRSYAAITVTTPTSIVEVAPSWLRDVAYNMDGNTHETNLVWNSTIPLKWQVSKENNVVVGAGWSNPSTFQTKYTGDSFVPGGYYERARLNPAVSGVGGIVPGETYTVRLVPDTDTIEPTFQFSWVATNPGNTSVQAIPLIRAQVIDGPFRFDVAGVTYIGFGYFVALDGTTPVAITHSSVKFIVGTSTETKAAAQTRIRSGTGGTTYNASVVSNIRALANLAPTVTNPIPDYTVTVGSTVNISLPNGQFSDADGTVVSVGVVPMPPGLAFSTVTRQITGTPTTVGTYTVNVVGTDNGGASVTDTFTLTIVAAGSFSAGTSETYTGTFVSDDGMNTNPGFSAFTLDTYNSTTKTYTIEQVDTHVVGSGKAKYFSVNGSLWTTLSGVLAKTYEAGVPYVITAVENTSGIPFNDTHLIVPGNVNVGEQSFNVQ